MIDIVIPYHEQGNDWKLRATLRGIDQNLSGDYRIIIIGDYPGWLRNVTYFHHKRYEGADMVRCYDANSKILAVCDNGSIADRFVVWHDDMLLVSPINILDIVVRNYRMKEYYVKELGHLKEYGSRWQAELLVPTMQALTHDNLRTYSWETHVPRYYSKEGLLRAFLRWNILENNYLYASMYYNMIGAKGVDLRDVKYRAAFVGYEGPYSLPMDDQAVDTAFGEYVFINWNDAGLTPYLKHRIINYVNESCFYEK